MTFNGLHQYACDAGPRPAGSLRHRRDAEHAESMDPFPRVVPAQASAPSAPLRSDLPRLLETRDGSQQTLKQHLWGARYIDELVQVAVNTDPTADNTADAPYYAMQNANFNVLGITDPNGVLVERYEYTPYGQRTVYAKFGPDDALTTAPLHHSQQVATATARHPYTLCDIGHQGLMHDREFGLLYSRYRHLDPRTGRWTARDRAGYVDGLHTYLAWRANPLVFGDPFGLDSQSYVDIPEETTNTIVPAGQVGIQPAPPSPYLLTAVEDQGQIIGHIRIDHFGVRAEYTLSALDTSAGPEWYYGATISGGFTARGSPADPPHCCQELRWSQLLLKAEHSGKPFHQAGEFDGFDNRGRQRSPFYYRDGPPPATAPIAPLWAMTFEDEYHGAHVNDDGYTLSFGDRPGTPTPLLPAAYRFKLCLVCVTHRSPQQIQTPWGAVAPLHKGYGRVLKCITYGYDADEKGNVTLERPQVCSDHSLPGSRVGWVLE